MKKQKKQKQNHPLMEKFISDPAAALPKKQICHYTYSDGDSIFFPVTNIRLT